jgi:hypothetical protein
MAKSRSRSRSRSRKGNAFTQLVKKVAKENPSLHGKALFKHASKIYRAEGGKAKSRSRSRSRKSRSRSRSRK